MPQPEPLPGIELSEREQEMLLKLPARADGGYICREVWEMAAFGGLLINRLGDDTGGRWGLTPLGVRYADRLREERSSGPAAGA